MNGETTKFAAFSCTHSPLHDEEAVQWALGELEAFKPDQVIHLGDFLEADPPSKYPTEEEWSLEDEYIAADILLRRFREVTPEAKHVLLIGNHDARILKKNGTINKRIRSCLNFKRWIKEIGEGHWEMPVDYIRNKYGFYRIGQVDFNHGYSIGGAPAQKFFAMKYARRWGLTVWGHTHKPIAPLRPGMPSVKLDKWVCNTGCLRSMDNVHWMNERDMDDWGQALLLGEVRHWRYDASLVPDYKSWDAELKVFRIYGDG